MWKLVVTCRFAINIIITPLTVRDFDGRFFPTNTGLQAMSILFGSSPLMAPLTTYRSAGKGFVLSLQELFFYSRSDESHAAAVRAPAWHLDQEGPDEGSVGHFE